MSVGLLTSITLCMSVGQLHKHYTMSLYVSRSSNQHYIMYVNRITPSTLHYGFMSVGLLNTIAPCMSVGKLHQHYTMSLYASRSCNRHYIMYVSRLTPSILHYGFMSVGLLTSITLRMSVGPLHQHYTMSVCQ